ncbi:NADP-dependent oxidoreductase [Luteimonas saliphila]|uniref:NADP-dependent oxidoreductase n=1 Tax=Luteimonas saliphila TaxID=2804919 RepID=UPI00192D3C23|nr:NADP-dependent oxidoreductase [Luteimonas saliphila]
MTASREVRLKRRPEGMPVREDFELATIDVPAPEPGEVQVRNLWMAVDPAMRGRMSEARSYVPPFALDAAMEGPAIGRVVVSGDPAFAPGDVVWSRLGWREVFNAPASALKHRDCTVLPEQAHLGIGGTTGLTAWIGLLQIAALKPDDVVFVSAGSGGVGSIVCQIARLKGHRVIASAGGERKTAFLREVIGVDAAIDYKAEPNLTKALARVAPEGIDVYFDNVGGEHLHAALAIANAHARFALCGMISQYNTTDAPTAPRNLMQAVVKRIRMEGFIVLDHLHREREFLADVTGWYRDGLLKQAETVHAGIDHALDAFFGLFSGDNLGRMMVKLA